MSGGEDMRAVVEALGFEPDNHHNALKCPYCNPDGLTLSASPASPDREGLVEAVARMRERCAERHDWLAKDRANGHSGKPEWATVTVELTDLEALLSLFPPPSGGGGLSRDHAPTADAACVAEATTLVTGEEGQS